LSRNAFNQLEVPVLKENKTELIFLLERKAHGGELYSTKGKLQLRNKEYEGGMIFLNNDEKSGYITLMDNGNK
jgi:hypothetical protein